MKDNSTIYIALDDNNKVPFTAYSNPIALLHSLLEEIQENDMSLLKIEHQDNILEELCKLGEYHLITDDYIYHIYKLKLEDSNMITSSSYCNGRW